MPAAEPAPPHGRLRLAADAVPERVRAVLARLRESSHEAWLVGGCVRDLARGEPVHDFDIATAALPAAVLALFPHAVPIGLRFGTVMIPHRDGPLDVTSYREASLEEDLAHRDLSVNAMAWDPETDVLRDPFEGLADLRGRTLRAVGSARERLAEDPLRAVRIARLVAQLGFALHPDLEPAIRDARGGARRMARERVRRELEALLLAEHAGDGLELLRRTGIEADLAPGTAADAPAIVDRLPRELADRLAGWLRGTDAETVLRRLRFPHALAARLGRRVRLHPLDLQADPTRPGEVRRLLKRCGDEGMGPLVRLRTAELDVRGASADDPARARLRALEDAVTALAGRGALALGRRDLALDGSAAMAILDCGPGRRVGRALEYLTERVLDDPACNTPERLEALLHEWAE